MTNRQDGGRKAAETNKQKYGDDFYSKISRKSQKAWVENGRKPRGFSAMTPEARRAAGVKGGSATKKQRNG